MINPKNGANLNRRRGAEASIGVDQEIRRIETKIEKKISENDCLRYYIIKHKKK